MSTQDEENKARFDAAIELANVRRKRREQQGQNYFVDLQKNEQLIAQNASTIYAGYVSAGLVNDATEEDLLSKSVLASIKIAYRVESWVTEKEEQVDDFS